MSDTDPRAASSAARCNRCGQSYPQHPADPAHVEVHTLRWTGGYGSVFPGDVKRVTLALCEFCTMVLCSEMRVPPVVESMWVSGEVYRAASPGESRALQGICLGDEEVALRIASTPTPLALATHAHFAGYLAHRRAFGDPQPDLTRRVAKVLSATIDAEGSAWRNAEGIEDPRRARAAFGVTIERAKELRGLVREIAEGGEAAS